ncbi:MAG: hypothetical protein K5984_03705, partial [Bacteroidales bacterium]|nr:hypothetical protein [Bacteroidales bacterium]
MKRILIVLAIFASVQVANAQVSKAVLSAKSAVESAVKGTENEKKAAKASTWTKLGQAYLKAYDAPSANTMVGASKQELTLMLGSEKPSAVENVELGGVNYTKEIFADKNLYFSENGQLQLVEVTAPAYEDALGEAIKAFNKSASLDDKGAEKKNISEGLSDIAKKYVELAYTEYSLGDIAGASKAFESAYEVSTSEFVSPVDTGSLYNAGFTAQAAGDLARAKGFFEKCLTYEYYGEDGAVYSKLAEIAEKQEDKALSKDYLEKGFEKFPQSQGILVGLINYYVANKENPAKLFELLDKAKENEPNNASIYYVEGNIHKELGERDAAVAAYQKCAEINPEYEYGFYGEGVLYYDEAVAIQTKAQDELDDNKYQALVTDFEKALKSCLEPFEKAYSVSKDEALKLNCAFYLKNAYFRFRGESAEYQAAYDKYA